MTSAGSPVDSRRGARRWWLLAAVLMFIAAGCFLVGMRGQQEPLAVRARPPLAPPSSAGGAAPRPAEVASPVARPAPAPGPVELRIPAIGVAASVSQLGVNRDGTVQVPTDADKAGWFRLGPSPGQMGSAVILGHVDSQQGPAVFYRLRFLGPGDRVAVRLTDGAVAHFVVKRVATYPNEQFPAREVYASHGYRALHLITCGGEFDSQTGYQSNVVVYTRLVGTPPAASRGQE